MSIGKGIAIAAIWLSPATILLALRNRPDILTYEHIFEAGGALLFSMVFSTCALSC